jgi:hypothetical protein
VRNPLDLSYQNPLDARSAWEFEAYTRRSSGGITFQRSVIEIQKPISWKKRRPSLRRLRKSSKSEVSKSSGGRTSSSVGSWWRIPQTIRFEVGAQTLTLCRSRRGDLEDLNGWWRTLEESREIPQAIGSSGGWSISQFQVPRVGRTEILVSQNHELK